MNQSLAIVVLAAGKGTRMKSTKAKVLHPCFYSTMIEHVISSTLPLDAAKTIVVVGHQKNAVKDCLTSYDLLFAEQKEQLGTGHAVLAAQKAIGPFAGTVMILCGDTPLLRPSLLSGLFRQHLQSQSTVTLLTTRLDNPSNYGRIISDTNGNITGIVEHKDANEKQLAIQEVNAGVYCVEKDFLFSTLAGVGRDNSQGEVYLTDIIGAACTEGIKIGKYTAVDSVEVLGVNSRSELAQAEKVLQLRHNETLMAAGVSMISPESIRISPDAEIQPDCLVEPGVHISGKSCIGQGTRIQQGSILENCTVGKNVNIGPYAVLSGVSVKDGSSIAPQTLRR